MASGVFGARALTGVAGIDFEAPLGCIGKEAVSVGVGVVQSSEPPPPAAGVATTLGGTFANTSTVEIVNVTLARRLADEDHPGNRSIGAREMKLVAAAEPLAGVAVVPVTDASEMGSAVERWVSFGCGAMISSVPGKRGAEEKQLVMFSLEKLQQVGADLAKVPHEQLQSKGLFGVMQLLKDKDALMPGIVPMAVARVLAEHV